MDRYELKQYLRKRGVTYDALAELAGVNKETIGRFLNGKGEGTTETVEKIFSALGLEPSSFEDEPVPSKLYNVEEWRKRKKELHLRFEDISQQSGIPMSTVQDLFQGRTRSPRVDTVNAIARVLGLQKPRSEDNSVASNSSLVLSEKEARMLSAFRRLVPAMQDNVIGIVENLAEQTVKRGVS